VTGPKICARGIALKNTALSRNDGLRNHCFGGAFVLARRLLRRLEREISMVRKIVTAGLLAGMFTLAACNTVAGAGKDVSSVGNATTKAADGAK
jgi:entericidin B